MGEVYEAWHIDLRKRVAVKILLPSMTTRPEVLARFIREGQAMARMRHPNAVDVSDVGVHAGVPFLVMEFLEGEDLDALIAREAPLAPERVAEILVPVIAAVQAAHDERIVHRDLKPANIFLHRGRDQRIVPKVLDFGISKMPGDGDESPLTQTDAVLGTPHYMSPEQVKGAKNVDAQSDQYSMGAILYECATKQRPFRGETLWVLMSAIVAGQFAPPRSVVPSLPAEFDALLRRAMSREPGDRFPSMRALGEALLAFADARTRSRWEDAFDGAGEPPRASSPPTAYLSAPPSVPSGLHPVPNSLVGASTNVPVAEPSTPRSRRGVVAGVAVAAMALALLLGFALLRDGGSDTRAPHATAAPPRVAPAALPVPLAPPPARPTAPAPAPSPVAAPPSARAVPVAAAPVAAPATSPSAEAHRRRRSRRSERGVESVPMIYAPAAPAPHAAGTNAIPILQ